MPSSFPILVGASAVARSTAKLMKTGQITSYRTGDDGDLEAGRGVDFFTLAENNPFGNTNRFTDELGGQTCTNNWVVDWSTYDGLTVLGYFRTVQTAAVWNDAIDNCLSGTFGTFTGCYLPNLHELQNIILVEGGISNLLLNYAPINIGNIQIISSTTNKASSTTCWGINASSFGNFGSSVSKSSLNAYIPVRDFTVTGTILT